MAKALTHPIACIDGLPELQQEMSNCRDMVALLYAAVPGPVERERLTRSVEAHTGALPDLTDWRAGDPSEWTPGKREG